MSKTIDLSTVDVIHGNESEGAVGDLFIVGGPSLTQTPCPNEAYDARSLSNSPTGMMPGLIYQFMYRPLSRLAACVMLGADAYREASYLPLSAPVHHAQFAGLDEQLRRMVFKAPVLQHLPIRLRQRLHLVTPQLSPRRMTDNERRALEAGLARD